MAKLSRRAVASSSSSQSSSSSSSTSSASTSSTSTSTSTLTSAANSASNVAAAVASNNIRVAALRANYATTTIRPKDSQIHHNTAHQSATTATPYTPQKNLTDAEIQLLERERIRAEFYATYDVMTGVRIAATLGGFFGLMVFLIVWKSRSSSNETLKVLKDPKMAAVAAVCMQEEEEREIQEAFVAVGRSMCPDEYDAMVYRRQRMMSLGNVSAPPLLNRSYRFSSVGGGGYSSLLEPPRRFSYSAMSGGGGSFCGARRRSGSESSRIFSNYPMGSSFGADDYFIETEDEMENDEYLQREQYYDEIDEIEMHKRTDSTKSKPGFLAVPLPGHDSRRSSAMTCCSTDSSYLERRNSAYTLGMSNLPPTLQRKLSTASRTSSIENWDYYYPDIQVIQPTPKASPCPSERSVHEQYYPQQQQQQQKSQSWQDPQQLQNSHSKTTTATTITTTTSTSTQKSAPTSLSQSVALGTKPTTPPTTSKTAKSQSQTAAKIAATSKLNGGAAPSFVRKHSIVSYDPESAQAGRKQQIHSISADTVDVYPYNQTNLDIGGSNGVSRGVDMLSKSIQSTPPTSAQQAFHFTDSPTEELRLGVVGGGARRKIAVVELQRLPPYMEQAANNNNTNSSNNQNNNVCQYPLIETTANAGVVSIATVTGQGTSSSISIDSTPISLDRLNGSGSLGTISGKALFNAEKRAPLASLSSFKISSLEYQDSDVRSLEEDSVFLEDVVDDGDGAGATAADTDEDMQQLSSDSEEVSLGSGAAAIGGTHDVIYTRENTILLASSAASAQHIEHSATPVTTIRVQQQPSPQQPQQQQRHSQIQQQQPQKYASDKRFSLAGITSGIRPRRPLLQRNRTISATSSDRISLIGQPLQEFQTGGLTTTGGGSQTLPLETHFGAVICTSSPPTHPRRAQLLQQYSDPHSLPTATTTTTTTTTEDDTCSTLNTELGLGLGDGSTLGTPLAISGGGGGCESSTHTQYSSLNTVISIGRVSPLTEQNYAGSSVSPASPILVSSTDTRMNHEGQQQKQQKEQQQQKLLQKLPHSRFADDPCTSSVSDSVLNTRPQANICMPASFKQLIVRGTNTNGSNGGKVKSLTVTSTCSAPTTLSRSVTNLSATTDCHARSNFTTPTPIVMLELPLIKLPTDECPSDNVSVASIEDMERSSRSKSDDSRDPSLPGASRKWSKETLF